MKLEQNVSAQGKIEKHKASQSARKTYIDINKQDKLKTDANT